MMKLLQAVPNVDDQQWTTKLCDLPKITFSTIYNYFLVEHKVLLQRVSYLESLADRRAELSGKPDSDSAAKGDENVPIGYTRTLDKAYVTGSAKTSQLRTRI